MGVYGTEERCEAALEQIRWAEGAYLSSMQGEKHGLVIRPSHEGYQCRQCGDPTILTTGTVMEATKLPLTTWFLAFY
jgi:hypothetical protein